MDIPFLGKSTDQKIEEAVSAQTQARPQQHLDLSGADKPAQFGYWEQAQDFTVELQFIKSMLEGKILCHSKQGAYWDYPKDESGKEVKKPFCTTEGQSWIMSFIAPYLQKGTTLSNYKIETVLDRCNEDAAVLNETLYLNAREWKIDPTKFGALVEVCMDRIEAARRRAVDNEERSTVGKVISAIFNMSASTTPKQASILGYNRKSGL